MIMLSVSAVANMSLFLLSASSAQSMFSLFNAIQLFLLLPLIGTFMPWKVIDYLTSLNFTLVSMDFIPLGKGGKMQSIMEMVDYEQTNSYLELLDLESSSAFINLLKMAITPLAFIFILLCL